MENGRTVKRTGHGHDDLTDHERSPLLPSSSHDHTHTLADGIHHEGESGRKGFHVRHFFTIAWQSSNLVSMLVNVLWPFVPVALGLQYATNAHLYVFAMAYVGMAPAANLLGFAGQEFARKLPKAAGILIETALG
jgi:Ca2+:H+ antiporter